MQNKKPMLTPSLISALSELSSQDAETSRNEVLDWVQNLSKEIEENGSATVETMGSFTKIEGRLCFNPYREFELDLNVAFNGLEPIDLQRAGKALGIEQMEDLEQATKSLPEEVFEPHKQPDSKASKEGKTQKAELEDKPTAQEKGIKTRDPKKSEHVESSSKKDLAPDKPEQAKVKKATQKVVNAKKKTTSYSGTIAVAAIVLVAAILFLIYNLRNVQQNPVIPADPNVIVSPNVNQEQDDDSLFAEQKQIEAKATSEGEPEMNQSADQAATPAQSRQDDILEEIPDFGLKGPVKTTVTEFYTIVIHSVQFEANAIREKMRLADMGYRVSIEQADVNGTTTFRVGIGQFESLEDAKTASQSLPSSVNSFFFKRFNLN